MPDFFALDFPDSEVHAVDTAAGTLRLRFSAAHARRGADAASGYLAGVEIAATGATWQGDAASALGRVAAGRLQLDGRGVQASIPLSLAGAVTLALRFANGTVFELRADALGIGVADAARFNEDFSC